MSPLSHYRLRFYFREFRRIGLTALAAWQLARRSV